MISLECSVLWYEPWVSKEVHSQTKPDTKQVDGMVKMTGHNLIKIIKSDKITIADFNRTFIKNLIKHRI